MNTPTGRPAVPKVNGFDRTAQEEPQWNQADFPYDEQYEREIEREIRQENALGNLQPWKDEPPPPTVSERVWEEGRDNFVEKFIELQGLSETPTIYYRFVALSVISALLQNNVWVELYPGRPLYPNLYVFLLGPSGIGKGLSIASGMQLLESCGFEDECGAFTGSFTSASLIDFLASKNGRGRAGTSRAFVVSPEFASSIKWGDQSIAIVKTMTDLFTSDLTNYTDMTRTKGTVKIGKPCVSWLAASTREWLISNLKPDAIRGGFMARCLFAEAKEKNPGVSLPKKPADYTERFAALQLHLIDRIAKLRGEFVLDGLATTYLKDWYASRIRPASEEARASWNRHRELALKVATILCAGDPYTKANTITFNHLYEAVMIVEDVKEDESKLWTFVARAGKSQDIEYVARRIEKSGTIEHTALLNFASAARGILAKKLAEFLVTLEDAGKIRRFRKPKPFALKGSPPQGKQCYEWIAPERPKILSNNWQDDDE